MPRLFYVLLTLPMVFACVSSDDGRRPADRLANTCQVRRCACGPEGWSSFMAGGAVQVLWRENGEAYCPDGYRLSLIESPPRP